jgi:hypothetical protein
LIGGALLAAKMPIATVFLIVAIPSVCAALAVIAMGLVLQGSTRA